MNPERTLRQAAHPSGYARQPTLLASKVRRLAGPLHASVRQRLLPTADDLTATRLFVLKAKAGYGKTTLLRQYAERIERLGYKTAWLRLDAADNSPAKTLAYLVAAFAELSPEVGAELSVYMSALPPLPPEDVLAELIHRLDRYGTHIFLLVDDYHAISNPAVHDLVAYFVAHLPSNAHLVIATRRVLPWNLSEIAHGGAVRTYDEGDIRFRTEEIAEYLDVFHGLRLDEEALHAIQRDTEGWITAVKLVSHGADRRSGRLATRRVDAAGHRDLFAYLASAVFDRLDWETQEFLLLTAPLERLSASLCDAVTGANSAHAMLERLVRENLFVEPLDAQGTWYRYHSLFSEFLRDHLARRPELDVRAVNRRASYWFEVNRQPHAAAEHAMAAGDAARHEALIEAAILDLVRGSQISLALSWFDTLPAGFSASKPDVLIPMAWCNIYLKRMDLALDLLARARQLLTDGADRLSPPDLARRDEFLVEIELAEMDAARSSRGELPDVRRLQAIKDRQQPGWDFIRAYVELLFCRAHISDDSLDAAFAAASEAVVYAKKVPNAFVANLALEQLAQIRYLQGRLADALALCAGAIELAYGATGQPLPVVAHFHLLLAQIHYEANDLELSRRHLQAASELTPLNNSPELLSEAEILAAKHLDALSGEQAALSRLIEYNNAQLDLSPPDAIARVRGCQVWFHTAAGELEAAEGVLRQMGAPVGRAGPPATLTVDPRAEFDFLALCRWQIVSGRAETAVNWLRHLLRLAERSGRLRSCVALNGLLALAQRERGQPDSALRYLRDMLVMGEQGGFARTIVDLGADLLPLLSEYQSKLAGGAGGERSDYVARLIGIARGAGGTLSPGGVGRMGRAPGAAYADEDMEALTPREVQILEMISVGRRNREVADELLIAESSVRWHVRNLYAKLGVHNRTEASAKGRSLKLIH